jgi:PAS domain S-box-containing protein
LNLTEHTSVWDDQLTEMLEVPAESRSKIYYWWKNAIHADDWERVNARLRDALATGSYNCDYRVRTGTNRLRYLSSRGMVQYDISGAPTKVIGVSWDETENRVAHNAVIESERRFRHVADSAPVLIWMTDVNQQATYFNKGWLDFTGHKVSENVGRGWIRTIHPEDVDAFTKTFSESFEKRIAFQLKLRVKNGCNVFRWLQIHGTPRFDIDQEFLGFIGSCIDVSESVAMANTLEQNQAQLEELLEEKDFLIREIHHRVKNNLQVMSSVLFLKAQTLKDPAMRQLLTESRQRLRSIAMIHERLMQSGGHITQISIKDYLLGLIQEQKQALLIDPEFITVETEVEDRMMNLDQVVNIGFIINETFTNSIKHAFPVRQKGLINVSFKAIKDGLQLDIADNGIGLPDHVNLNNNTLFGIQLIKVFTSHLGGEVHLSGTRGTKWTVNFN